MKLDPHLLSPLFEKDRVRGLGNRRSTAVAARIDPRRSRSLIWGQRMRKTWPTILESTALDRGTNCSIVVTKICRAYRFFLPSPAGKLEDLSALWNLCGGLDDHDITPPPQRSPIQSFASSPNDWDSTDNPPHNIHWNPQKLSRFSPHADSSRSVIRRLSYSCPIHAAAPTACVRCTHETLMQDACALVRYSSPTQGFATPSSSHLEEHGNPDT